MLQTYLGLLRGVGVVIIDGVPAQYVDFIKRKMMGFEPADPLFQMYEELERYTYSISFCKIRLEKACLAMEEGDIESFIGHRKVIVDRMTQHVEAMTRNVYRHDP